MNSIRVMGVIGFVIIITVFMLAIPEDVNETTLQRNADVLGVTPEDIIRESKQQSIINNILEKEPDYVIDDIKFYVDEIPANVTSVITKKYLQLERTITFDDGSVDKEIIESALFETLKLDFISLKDDSRPLTNGKINLKLYTIIDKEIQIAEGEFTVFFGVDRSIVKSSSPRLMQSDVVNGTLIMFNYDVDLKSLLSSRGEGIYPLELRLEKLFIVFKDDSREYVNPLQVLYTINIEKNLSKSIVKDETNNFIKIFDSDVPITISANQQSVTALFCNSYYRAGGCASSYSQTAVIPAPALGTVTISDSSGKILASKPSMGAGYCLQEQDRLVYGSSKCISVSGGGGSLSFNAQRGESYKITVSDPSKSWIVKVPESGGSIGYSCIDSKSYHLGGYSLSGIPYYVIDSLGRVCNFP